MFTIGLPVEGRLKNGAVEFYQENYGWEIKLQSRKLRQQVDMRYQVLFTGQRSIIQSVAQGLFCEGIVGYNALLEYDKYEDLNIEPLDFAHCQLAVLYPERLNWRLEKTVLSSHPVWTKKLLGSDVEIIHVEKSLEGLVGLRAEVGIDIVETGATARANGLTIHNLALSEAVRIRRKS